MERGSRHRGQRSRGRRGGSRGNFEGGRGSERERHRGPSLSLKPIDSFLNQDG